MPLLHQAFRLSRPANSSLRRNGRRLQFETLESREVFTTSPFTIINNTTVDAAGHLAFLDTQIDIALYAQDYTDKQYYYFDASGTAHLTTSIPLNADNQRIIPTFRLYDLTTTGSHTHVINLPQTLGSSSFGLDSARMYFSLHTPSMNAPPLNLTVNADGSVNGPLPGKNFFDFVEFSLNAPDNPTGNLNIDTTNVDQFGVPIKVTVDSTDPTPPEGVGISILRSEVIQKYQDFTSAANDPYAVCIWPTSDPNYGPYRILNPSGVLSQAASATNKVDAETTLLGAVDATATKLHVYSAGAFPDAYPFKIRIFKEIMTVTGATKLDDGTSMWTVTRGVDGTSAAPHVNGASISTAGPAVTASQTTLTVQNTVGFPPKPTTTDPFRIRVGSEIMTVTGVKSVNHDGTTTWNVLRAQDGSSASFHVQDAIVFYDSVTNLALNSNFNEAIDNLFTKYKDATGTNRLEVYSNADGTGTVYEGTVTTDTNGAYVMRFTAQGDPGGVSYDVYYPFFEINRYYWGGYTPKLTVTSPPTWEAGANVGALSPSEMVFACNGVFADQKYRPAGYSADQLKVLADLENQMVSALNRGVALLPGYSGSTTDPTNSWKDTSLYYQNNTDGQVWNRYAQFLHKSDVSIDGLNYGFPFDDQAGQASDIGVGTFTNATIKLGGWENNPTEAASQRSLISSNLITSGSTSSPSVPSSSPTVLSLRMFLSSYFAAATPTAITASPLAVSQLAVAAPQASPMAVDAAMVADPTEDPALDLVNFAVETANQLSTTAKSDSTSPFAALATSPSDLLN